MGKQQLEKMNPLFVRINDEATAKYVFRFTIKYFYIIAGIYLFVSITEHLPVYKLISSLITLLLTLILHIYKSRFMAITFIFLTSCNMLLMLSKSIEPDNIIFQLFFIVLGIRSLQAASYLFQIKHGPYDQTA